MSNRVRNGLDNLSVDLAQFRLSEWSSCHPLIRSNKRFSFTRVFSATAINVTLIFTIWCRPLQQIGLGIGSGCVGSTRFFYPDGPDHRSSVYPDHDPWVPVFSFIYCFLISQPNSYFYSFELCIELCIPFPVYFTVWRCESGFDKLFASRFLNWNSMEC